MCFLIITQVFENWTNKSHIESKYSTLEEKYLQQVKRCIELGLNCVEIDPKNRPTAGSILAKLEGRTIIYPVQDLT